MMTEPNKYEMHGALTTTADSSESELQPRDESSAPTETSNPQPNAPRLNAPLQGGPTTPAPAPQPQPQSQPQPSMHARIFDKILRGMTGGDIKVVNPDGTVSSYAPSKADMGKSIIAAALTGLMTPPRYEQGAFGPKRDVGAEASDAFNAGRQTMQTAREGPQKMSDEMQARKLTNLQNNAHLMQLQIASANLKHTRREQSSQEIADYMKPFQDYNAERDASDSSTPNAYLFQGMSHEEALKAASQHGMTETNLVQDGWKPYVDPETHQQDYEPTYAAINPELKNVKLSPEVAKRLSDMNSQYANIHETVGGDVRVPVGLYVSALHDYQALTQTQDVLNRLNKTINGDKAKDINLAPIVKANRNQLVPALYKIQQAIAAGHGADDGENPANVLDVIMGNAPQLLKELGLTTGQAADKVTDFTAKRAAELAKAKNEGTSKEAVDDEYKNGLIAATATLPEAQQKDILPILKQDVVSKREAEKASAMIAGYQKANQSDASRTALAGGSPQEIAKFAHNVVRGDISQIDKLPTRGDARIKAMGAVHDEAAKLGLDTTKYTDSYLKTKADMQDDYAQRKGKTTGAQLASFDAFLGHTGGAMDALDALKSKTIGLTRQPLINQAMDTVGKQITDTPEWKRWETSLAPVRNEISNFLAAGYSPKEEEQRAINTILDKHETPARISAAIAELAQVADTRLASLGRGYTQTMDNNYPELLSSDALNSMKRLGIKSKAAGFSGKLPYGWDAQGEFQNLTDVNLAKKFVAAAGGDRQRTKDIARANGWILH
jgi:hypothetical protein